MPYKKVVVRELDPTEFPPLNIAASQYIGVFYRPILIQLPIAITERPNTFLAGLVGTARILPARSPLPIHFDRHILWDVGQQGREFALTVATREVPRREQEPPPRVTDAHFHIAI